MKKSVIRFTALILVIVAGLAVVPAAFAADTEVVKDEATLYRDEVLRLVNIERVKANLTELKYSDEAQQIADVRATECNTTFSHTRPNNTKWSTVFAEGKISYKFAGENLGSGASTPEKVVTAWMNSEGHRANILDKDFEFVSIGYFKNTSGKIFCSQLFYTPKLAK